MDFETKYAIVSIVLCTVLSIVACSGDDSSDDTMANATVVPGSPVIQVRQVCLNGIVYYASLVREPDWYTLAPKLKNAEVVGNGVFGKAAVAVECK